MHTLRKQWHLGRQRNCLSAQIELSCLFVFYFFVFQGDFCFTNPEDVSHCKLTWQHGAPHRGDDNTSTVGTARYQAPGSRLQARCRTTLARPSERWEFAILEYDCGKIDGEERGYRTRQVGCCVCVCVLEDNVCTYQGMDNPAARITGCEVHTDLRLGRIIQTP